MFFSRVPAGPGPLLLTTNKQPSKGEKNMFCCITGEAPKEPVISRLSGHLYERSVILKYIHAEGKCPATGGSLHETDLLHVACHPMVRPKVATSASIPGILSMLQNEWDDVMLEMFTLKQHLDKTRAELSQALYQNDAACRVIARLMRERDEAQAMLINQKPAGKQVDHYIPMEIQHDQPMTSNVPLVGLSTTILNEIVDKSKELSAGRKGRKVSMSLASKDHISSYSCKEEYNPHSGEVTCIAVRSSINSLITNVVTGGSDKKIIISDNTNDKPVATLSGHTKKVTHVTVHGVDMKRICSAAADRMIKIWDAKGSDLSHGYNNSYTFSPHKSDITSISLSPTGNYLLSAADDWCLHDIDLGQTVYTNSSGNGGYTCCGLHPDGLVFGTGTTAHTIKIWDIRDGSKNVAECVDHTSLTSHLTFSENGYILASGANDGQVKLWDLRKMKCIHTLDGNLSVTSMAFDYSGTFLAVARREALAIYMGKDWICIKNENVSKKVVSGVAWNADAMGYWTTSLDKTVKYYSM